MEEDEDKLMNISAVKESLLDTSIGTDSNSLEPGEVVEDKTPPRSGVEDTSGVVIDTDEISTKINNAGSSNNTTPSKSVLGKEKAKQKLKAMGIQKKIQMESKNIRTPQKRKNSREKSGSSSKKDKPPTPHEKAKLTKEEIEKMKEKQDCALPCLYYDAAMIHHIQAECPEEKPSTLGKVEPCLTASLEAIKNYEDQDEIPGGGGGGVGTALKRDQDEIPGDSGGTVGTAFKRDQDEIPGGSGGSVGTAFKRRRYGDDNIRNFKQIRRKLYYPEMNTFVGRGRKRFNINRERLMKPYGNIGMKPNDRERRNFNEQNKPENKLPRPFEVVRQLPTCKEDGLKYTETKPPISFAFNINAAMVQSTEPLLERKQKKSKKKKRHRSHEGSKKKKRTKQSLSDVESKKKSSKKKSKKKKTAEEKGDKKEKQGKKSKKSKKKKLQTRGGALSFHLDDFYPEEETESFPLCKDGVTATDDIEDDDTALENKLKSLQEELNKKSPSPDTDDYMANWEEEEDFVPTPVSKVSTPKVVMEHILKPSDEDPKPVQDDDLEKKSHNSEDNGGEKHIKEAQCDDEEEDEAEIRDGLGTPIFVNPSPPAELIANATKERERTPQIRIPELKVSPEIEEEYKEPKRQTSPLFGMQVIYEQFIQSVSEAGIELALDQRHSKDRRDFSFSSSPKEENSFTPKTSPGKSTMTTDLDELDEKAPPFPEDRTPSRSVSPTPSPSSPSGSSSSSSSTASSTENGNDEDSRTVREMKKRKKRIKSLPPVIDPQLSVLSPEDSKKLYSLQKRWRMLKTLQEQSDAMDDEDIQCLLGLEKLIEAEKSLLMRKYDLSEKNDSSDEKGKESDGTDSGAGTSSTLIDTSKVGSEEIKEGTTTPPRAEDNDVDLGKIFDTNREAIKLTISPKVQKSASKAEKKSDEEDQDFTEKLLKPSKDVLEKEDEARGNKESRVRKYSPPDSRSPELRKGTVRKGRSLSVSPDRRGRDRNRRSKRRQYSPPPRHPRLDSPTNSRNKRHELKRNRDRKRSLSPLIRRRSRSPYGRRFSRSPTFRPPSPKSPPPSRDSRSPSKERSPRLGSQLSSAHHYLWSEDSSTHYYPGYYYPSSPGHSSLDGTTENQGNQQSIRPYPPGAVAYSNYTTHYNAYSGDYSIMSGYANNYGNEYISSEPMNSYSRIPVINSTGANYYYNEFGADQTHSHEIAASGNRSISSSNKQVIQQDSPSVKSSTFVVQKGNVLEIVPTPVIPKQEPDDEVEDTPGDATDEISFDQEKLISEQEIKKEKVEEKRKKRKSVEFSSWEDEVAKRHIMSAVLRLNKEGDGALRGILCNKMTDPQSREKKKVLFADGIPPGKCSSTSDDDTSPLRSIRKRSKKKRRRGENKENENILLDSMDGINEIKVDPELENAPPPPPPPGSPPLNLEQPVLIRPPSPEQLLYFHFDSVVNSMYVSQLATPIPPRLLNRGIPPLLGGTPPKANGTNGNKENSNGKDNAKEDSKDGLSDMKEDAKESSVVNQEQESEPKKASGDSPMPESPKMLPPSPPPPKPQSPSLVQQRMDVSLIRSLTPPPRRSQKSPLDPRPASPMISGFSGFNRPPPRPIGNTIHPDFSVPPPSPQQVQPMLTHPSIPFGPRPPGGTANFNRNVPPPFNPPQQHLFRPPGISSPFNNSSNCETPPSPVPNIMPSTNFPQNDHMPPSPMATFRSSGVTSPFKNPTNIGNIQVFPPTNVIMGSNFNQKECHMTHSPAQSVRSSGMCSPFRNPASFESTSSYTGPANVRVPPSFTPPPSANNKPIQSLLGKPMNSHQFHTNNNPLPPQFHQNNNNNIPLMGNQNTAQNVRPSHPFSSNGMLSQMPQHRPNLGFPRSFGPLGSQHGGSHHHHHHHHPHQQQQQQQQQQQPQHQQHQQHQQQQQHHQQQQQHHQQQQQQHHHHHHHNHNMFGQSMSLIPPNQLPPNMPGFSPRPVYQTPGGVHHFMRAENISVDRSNQRVPPNATPPHPKNNGSPIMRPQGNKNNSL